MHLALGAIPYKVLCQIKDAAVMTHLHDSLTTQGHVIGEQSRQVQPRNKYIPIHLT